MKRTKQTRAMLLAVLMLLPCLPGCTETPTASNAADASPWPFDGPIPKTEAGQPLYDGPWPPRIDGLLPATDGPLPPIPDGAVVTEPLQNFEDVCRGKWCWENPRPHGIGMTAIFAHGQHIFLGSKGLVLHFDGTVWRPMTLPEDKEVTALSGSGPNDVVAVGTEGFIAHYDGNQWKTLDPGDIYKDDNGRLVSFTDVWRASDGTTYVVGGRNTIQRSSGGSFGAVNTGIDGGLTTWKAVWGADKNSVFIAGTGSMVLRFDGQRWRRESIPDRPAQMLGNAHYDFEGLHGSGPDNVYAVASFGAVVRYDGQSWKQLPLEMPHRDAESQLAGLRKAYAPASDALFVAGEFGTLRFYDGQSWRTDDSPHGSLWFSALHGTARNDVFAGGSFGSLAHYDGNRWRRVGWGSRAALSAVSGNAQVQYAVGVDGMLLQRHQGRWFRVDTGETFDFLDVHVFDDNRAVIVGLGDKSLHFENGKWVARDTGVTHLLRKVWGTSATNIYATAIGEWRERGLFLHFDGSSWRSIDFPGRQESHLGSIWGSGPDTIYVTGKDATGPGDGESRGVVLRYDGGWTEIDVGANADEKFGAIWGAHDKAIFIAGDEGRIYQYDGSWKKVSTLAKDIEAISGRSANEVVAYGGQFDLVVYDGTSWTIEKPRTSEAWYSDVWVGPDGAAFAVGAWGTIMRRAP